MARIGADGLARLGWCDRIVHQATEHIALAAIGAAHERGTADDDVVFRGVRQSYLHGACLGLVLVKDKVGIIAAKAEIANRSTARAVRSFPVLRL